MLEKAAYIWAMSSLPDDSPCCFSDIVIDTSSRRQGGLTMAGFAIVRASSSNGFDLAQHRIPPEGLLPCYCQFEKLNW